MFYEILVWINIPAYVDFSEWMNSSCDDARRIEKLSLLKVKLKLMKNLMTRSV